MDFEEVRHYAPGDDVRTIDWKVTARTRNPPHEGLQRRARAAVLLVVDQSGSMFFGSQVSMKSVTAAEIAALGAWRVLKQGDRVGGIVFGNEDLTETRPQRSRKRVLETPAKRRQTQRGTPTGRTCIQRHAQQRPPQG